MTALIRSVSACPLHLIYLFVNYDHLHPSYCSLALALVTELILKSYVDAMTVPHWKAATEAEYVALVLCGTWVLVSHP